MAAKPECLLLLLLFAYRARALEVVQTLAVVAYQPHDVLGKLLAQHSTLVDMCTGLGALACLSEIQSPLPCQQNLVVTHHLPPSASWSFWVLAVLFPLPQLPPAFASCPLVVPIALQSSPAVPLPGSL